MARFVLFLILLVPIVMAGNWLVAHPGVVDIHWLGYDIELHVAALATLVFLIVLVITAVVLMLWQLASWPERRRARRRYRTLARGLNQLTHGITALALGDEKHAEAAIKKAVALLPNEPLPQLLTAQLLQRQGKQDAARTQLRALLKHASTSMLASKRLIEQHVEQQEWDAAAALAEQIYSDTPNERWVVLTLLDLYARQGNTRGMLALSEGFQWKSPLSKDERNHFAGLAYYLQSQATENERNERTALRHAVGFAPDFLPALVDYARLLIVSGEARQARKWLLTAWLKQPRAMLIDPILQSLEAAAPKAQSRLLKPFLNHGESHEHALLRAAHALAMSDPATAETALEEAIGLYESREACLQMAEAEKLLRGEEAANRWMARAMRAPASEAWICHHCGTSHEVWAPHCHGCGAFDTLAFMRPEARVTSVEVATTN
jgi:HemY protein